MLLGDQAQQKTASVSLASEQAMNHYEKYGEYSRAADASETAKTALIFLGIGIGIGALISLLLAPHSGSEVRQAVRGKLDDARRGLSRQSNRVRQKVMPISRTQ